MTGDLASSDRVYVTLILFVEEEAEEIQEAGGTNAMAEREEILLDAHYIGDGVATDMWGMMVTMEEGNLRNEGNMQGRTLMVENMKARQQGMHIKQA